MRAVCVAFGILLGLNATSAAACGYCVEDKIAAVYDHAIVAKALGHKHRIVFFVITGTPPPGPGTPRVIERSVELAAGVDQGSVKVSTESATLSVAFDPQRISLAHLQEGIERQLARQKLTLQPLRIIDEYGQLGAVTPEK